MFWYGVSPQQNKYKNTKTQKQKGWTRAQDSLANFSGKPTQRVVVVLLQSDRP
jgi:hypothetical protein